MTQKEKPVQLEIFGKDQGLAYQKYGNQRNEILTEPQQHKTYSRIYIYVICALLLSITSYALGVERGKKITKKDTLPHRYVAKEMGDTAIPKTIEQKKDKPKTNEEIAQKEIEKEPEEKKTEARETFKGYVIQLVTYRKNSSYVEKAVSRIKEKGYKAIPIASGEYIQICAGTFSSHQAALPHLNKLKKIYKDCYIRKI